MAKVPPLVLEAPPGGHFCRDARQMKSLEIMIMSQMIHNSFSGGVHGFSSSISVWHTCTRWFWWLVGELLFTWFGLLKGTLFKMLENPWYQLNKLSFTVFIVLLSKGNTQHQLSFDFYDYMN